MYIRCYPKCELYGKIAVYTTKMGFYTAFGVKHSWAANKKNATEI